ncbi:MAG: phenylalanine--tRNA ligase subunit beta [Treponema sp.]|nr:phenylalanine--tRNA ligase subunit beta [Treponema sp.]
MPKIEVNEKLFFNLLGTKYDYDTLEKKLTCGKAELDEKPDMNQPADERVIKIELNDTNRPDLWSTGGVARQLRLHNGAKRSDYSSFMSYKNDIKDCGERVAIVDEAVKEVRPYMVSFVISGKPIDDPMLKDIIQTQEKLCWNFGRKRKTISMGVYRVAQIQWPVHYTAVDPDKTSFVPLQCTEPMTCRQIITDHPKGKEFGWILESAKVFPLLKDDKGEVMSMAPIINSATLGAVQVGDKDLMVELTGADMASLILSANIVACDFADAGYKILPVKTIHPYETGFGKEITVPFFFQENTKALLSSINKKLGSSLTKEQVIDALTRMDNTVSAKDISGDVEFTLTPPPYRNDFLHEVDVIEDVMIGVGLDNFTPAKPNDFTIGKLSPVTVFSRKTKEIMVGLGYQEMIFNYLGSKRDYIDRMNIDAKNVIEISNPMSENYQFVRPSIIASLLRAESGAANSIFPHKIFEIGKVAYLEPSENTGTKTIQSLGFLTASNNANFNDMASEVSSLLYFLDHKYEVKEAEDPRFIPGRQAAIIVNGKQAGIFGEIHPQVLENWQIGVPCAAGELDLEALMVLKSAEK